MILKIGQKKEKMSASVYGTRRKRRPPKMLVFFHNVCMFTVNLYIVGYQGDPKVSIKSCPQKSTSLYAIDRITPII